MADRNGRTRLSDSTAGLRPRSGSSRDSSIHRRIGRNHEFPGESRASPARPGTGPTGGRDVDDRPGHQGCTSTASTSAPPRGDEHDPSARNAGQHLRRGIRDRGAVSHDEVYPPDRRLSVVRRPNIVRISRHAMANLIVCMQTRLLNPQIPAFPAHFLYLQDASALQFLECTYRKTGRILRSKLFRAFENGLFRGFSKFYAGTRRSGEGGCRLHRPGVPAGGAGEAGSGPAAA